MSVSRASIRFRAVILAVFPALAWHGLPGCRVDFGDSGRTPDANIPPGCGNGTLETGEVCDGTDLGGQTCHSAVGHLHGQLACTGACQLDLRDCHTCGDGQLEGPEECDDHDAEPGDGCSESCLMEPGWVCVGEPSVCQQTCGNGVLDPGESCDDANIQPDDGCTPSCQQENGWSCQGTPSVCVTTCGDGLAVGTEECDDGNLIDGDGCDGVCQAEPFYACSGDPSVCVCVVYVDVNTVPGPRDGGSWQTALDSVQQAVNTAAAMNPCEVWVAAGRYHLYNASNSGVDLPSNAALYGGFRGIETDRDDRNWVFNETILDGTDGGTPPNHVYQVVTAQGVTNVILDGFTITEAAEGDQGGGLHVESSHQIQVNHCLIEGNQARDGAGVYCRESEVTYTGCTFVNNAALQRGGGLYIDRGSVVVRRCTFRANTAGRGGGIYARMPLPLTVVNSLFVANVASTSPGGGAYLENNGQAEFVNCTFNENTTSDSGASLYVQDTQTTVVNSILWGAMTSQIGTNLTPATVGYSIVRGGFAGVNVVDSDPLFVNPATGDFHLQQGSPAIDAADGDEAPPTDMAGTMRLDDPLTVDTGIGSPTYADMGAFEYQP